MMDRRIESAWCIILDNRILISTITDSKEMAERDLQTIPDYNRKYCTIEEIKLVRKKQKTPDASGVAK